MNDSYWEEEIYCPECKKVMPDGINDPITTSYSPCVYCGRKILKEVTLRKTYKSMAVWWNPSSWGWYKVTYEIKE